MKVFLKLAGSFLLLGTAAAAGFGTARGVEGQIEELRRLVTALQALSTEVSYVLKPLPQALTAAGQRAGGAVGELFCLLGSRSGLSGRRTPEDALETVLNETCLGELPRLARETIGELVKSLGTSGHTEQVRHIDMSIDRVRSFLSSMEVEYGKRARMYRYLGVLGGLMAVIVLI
ncbi:MAG TPA: hypothetical protein GX716_00505 [Firmicutes bacterium]|nr:hypothetical protein [Candidatus Fermentithermobacillaceae bacterium]